MKHDYQSQPLAYSVRTILAQMVHNCLKYADHFRNRDMHSQKPWPAYGLRGKFGRHHTFSVTTKYYNIWDYKRAPGSLQNLNTYEKLRLQSKSLPASD